MKTEINKKAEKVLNDFDYEKVHAYMVLTNWKWRGKVPEIFEIKTTAQILMEQAINRYLEKNESGSNRTGGLHVNIFKWNDKTYIKLSFQPVHSASF